MGKLVPHPPELANPADQQQGHERLWGVIASTAQCSTWGMLLQKAVGLRCQAVVETWIGVHLHLKSDFRFEGVMIGVTN